MTKQQMLDEIYDKIIFDWKPFLFNKGWNIGNVLGYIDSLETWLDGKDKAQWRTNVFWLLTLWGKKQKPIEEQDDECIEFVYNLIKK